MSNMKLEWVWTCVREMPNVSDDANLLKCILEHNIAFDELGEIDNPVTVRVDAFHQFSGDAAHTPGNKKVFHLLLGQNLVSVHIYPFEQQPFPAIGNGEREPDRK